jgi:serine/threonine protein kinase
VAETRDKDQIGHLWQAMKGKLSVARSYRSLPEELRIPSSRLTVGGSIGLGSQAEVFDGTFGGMQVAVKRIKSSSLTSRSRTDLVRELVIMAKTSHPNLVRLLGVCKQPGSLDTVLEFCGGGTLFHLLHIADVDLALWQQHSMALDVAGGMEYLHGFEPPIIHRDLKSLNVLLAEPITSERDTPHVKITDFGFAKMSVSRSMGFSAAGAQPEAAARGFTSVSPPIQSQTLQTSRGPSRSPTRLKTSRGPSLSPSRLKTSTTPSMSPSATPHRAMTAQSIDSGCSFTSMACRQTSKMSCMTPGVGTLQWMAPELHHGSTDYTSKVDVYAFGMLLFEIMCREPPFCDFERAELQELVTTGVRPEVPSDVPRFHMRVAESCWDARPAARPAFDELVLDLQEYGQLKGLDRASTWP